MKRTARREKRKGQRERGPTRLGGGLEEARRAQGCGAGWMSSFFSFGSRGRGSAAGSEDSGPPARSPGGKGAGAGAADGSGKRGTGSPIERRDSAGGGSVKFPPSQQAQGQSAGQPGPQAQHPFRGGLKEGSPVVPSSRGRGSGFAGPQAQRPLGGQLLHEVKSVGAFISHLFASCQRTRGCSWWLSCF